MGRCKEIEVRVIPARVAIPFVKEHHYSGKVVNNSTLHFGAFLDGRLHGVMSFGPSMDKRKMLSLVEGTGWSNFLELNRMAFDDYLPRNSESYCIGKALRLIRREAPHIKWVVSFADGTQCGDGTIYRASNFLLTQIKENKTILRMPDGSTVAKLTLALGGVASAKYAMMCGLDPQLPHTPAEYVKAGAKWMPGFQLRYVYFLDKKWRKRLTVPAIPFSEIDKMGAGMYKGEQVTREERHEKLSEAQKKE